jgi:hypothetical protein
MAKGECLLVQAALSGAHIEDVGILLIDSESDQLHIRFRRDCDAFAAHEADWFEDLGDEISTNAEKLGAQKYFDWMESTLSNALQVSRALAFSLTTITERPSACT